MIAYIAFCVLFNAFAFHVIVFHKMLAVTSIYYDLSVVSISEASVGG